MKRRVGLSAIALIPLGISPETAAAQSVELPAITVTASPIVRRAPRPAATPGPRETTSETLPETTPPPSPDLYRGTLPIVTDQFATVTVMPRDQIDRATGQTLGEILQEKPGITSSGFAPGAASRPIVRGLDNYRVRIQENGVGASGVSELGEDHAVPLDPVGMSRIEVVRGPATLRWGSQAIGGSVNASNNRIPEALPCSEGASPEERETGCARAETRSGVSTADSGLDAALLLDAGRGNVAVHADVHGRRASDYRIPAYPYLFPTNPPPPVFGRQPNSSNRSGGASLGGSYVFESGYFGAAVTQFNSFYRLPGVESTATATRINLRQTRVSAKGEFRTQSAYIAAIRVWSGQTDYKHHELANEEGFDGVHQTFTSKEAEVRAEILFVPVAAPFATLTSLAGVQASHQALTAPGLEGGLFDPNRTKSVAAFQFNEFNFGGGLRAQIAGRVERALVAGSFPELFVDPSVGLARTRNFTPKSGAIGFLQNLPWDMVASLTAQHMERAPRAPELLSRGVHESTGTFDIGDPDLQIEAANSVELGLRRAAGPFRFEATAYYTKFSGFIFRNLTGQTCEADFASCAPAGEGGDLKLAKYAQRDAIFRGGEFQSQWDVAPLLGGTAGIENQFDVVRASFAGGGNVPRIPPARVGGGLFWRDANWLARISLLRAFAQFAIDPAAETPTQGYNLLKAEISYRTKLCCGAGREMTLGLVGNNLLNERIRNHVSFRKDEVLLPGANVRFFANVAF